MNLPVQTPLFDHPAHPDWALIPVEQGRRLLNYEYCELSPDTSPWCGPYAALSTAIPLARTVVDLGCYMGLQAALFTNHAGYVGVDTAGVDGEPIPRLHLPNVRSFTANIRTVCERPDEFDVDPAVDFAICCWVPDSAAVAMVRQTFANVFVVYPSIADH